LLPLVKGVRGIPPLSFYYEGFAAGRGLGGFDRITG